MTTALLPSLLEASVAQFPAKTAIIAGSRRYTYEDLEAWSNRLAHSLLLKGIKRGDRIGIYLDNSFELVVAIFGVLKSAAVFVPIHSGIKPDKLDYLLKNSGASALITEAHRAVRSVDCEVMPALLETLPVNKPAVHSIDRDLAAIIYTSGSTGRPKGAMLTHLNMMSAVTSVNSYLSNTADDIVLNVLPMSHTYGLYQALMMCKVGGTLVLEKAFTYPWAVLRKMEKEKITGFPLVPSISSALLEADLRRVRLPHLRYISNAAAALPTSHIARLRIAFPDVKIFSMYGLTECARVSYLPPEEIDTRPASVGRAMPNTEVYVADAEGRHVPPGVVGELVVRGSNVMQGYWGDPEETRRALRDGPLPGDRVLHTGDLFRMDEEGFLYFVARGGDIIKTRGEKVSPAEVENVLCGIPDVVEAAVAGVPDEKLGEAVHAFVVLRAGSNCTERDILLHCANLLEAFMIPQRLQIVESLPKTTTGKLDRRALAALASVTESVAVPAAKRG